MILDEELSSALMGFLHVFHPTGWMTATPLLRTLCSMYQPLLSWGVFSLAHPRLPVSGQFVLIGQRGQMSSCHAKMTS